MQLLEVEVRHWRGLTARLADLSARLNLILGPNESGKSRLFQAIRYGLFETAKGTAQHKQSLQSWASADSPFVRIVFRTGGIEYELQKQFLKGAAARLAGGGDTLRGDDAEESLRSLLGARQPGMRGAATSDRGIWPMLMVSQGESRRPVQEDLNEDGRSRLQERLSGEIGVAAVSAAGLKSMALAEREYGQYFTASGQESKTLREIRAGLRSAEARLAEAATALERQEKTAAALAEKRRELKELQGRQEKAKQDAQAARFKAEAAQVAGTRTTQAQDRLNTAVERASSAQKALLARVEADEAIARLTADLDTLETELAGRARDTREYEQTAEAAGSELERARQRVRELQASIESDRREQRRAELGAARQELNGRIDRLRQLEAEIEAARTQRARIAPIDDACLARLQQLDRISRAAASKLQGAAVSVVIHLRSSAQVDGMTRQAGESVTLDIVENRRISLGEIAEIDIRPGGGELERLREASHAAESALTTALGAIPVADLEQAVLFHAARAEYGRQADELRKRARATSEKSVSQLREDLASVEADLQRLGQEAGTSQDESGSQEPFAGSRSAPARVEEISTRAGNAPARAESALARAEDALAGAEDAVVRAQSARDTANAAAAEFRSGTAALHARVETTRTERSLLVSRYQDRTPAGELRVALHEANAESERARGALLAAQREFSDLGGAEIQADSQRLVQAAEGLGSRVRDARTDVDQLQGALRSMVEAGNYETQEEAGAHVEQLRVEVSRLERQAAAARRLWEVLSEERRRVVEQLTAPVLLRIKPYLQDLFPGSTLDAGDELDVLGLQSGNLKEPFEELSGGAQEQISLLARIGIGEVLAGDSTLPLILDDALINTDPQRIRRVQRALYRAADKLQVIVFSCHDVLFDSLGAERIVQLPRAR